MYPGFFLFEYRRILKPPTVGSSRKEMFNLARNIGKGGGVKFLNLHIEIIVKELTLPFFLGGYKELYMVNKKIDIKIKVFDVTHPPPPAPPPDF